MDGKEPLARVQVFAACRGRHSNRSPDSSNISSPLFKGLPIEEIPEMSTDEIRARVKKSIATITNISFDEISDTASYKDDLQLDSLTILEIAVDAEYQFQVQISDDDLGEIRTVEDTVKMVQQYLSPAVV